MPPIAQISAFTHRGRVRAHNEDTIVVGDWLSPPQMDAPRVFRQRLPVVCAVADGMGGHRAGDVASRFAAQALAAAGAGLSSAQHVHACLAGIDAALNDLMIANAALTGMGTTIVGLVLADPLIWFNIGDSRLYRWRDGRLVQMSVDDTPPGPRSGLITQSLGGGLPEAPVPHVGEIALTPPARFLLCSDGLTDMLDDDDIAACLMLDDTDAVLELFETAMSAGGVDNVSIVVGSVEDGG
jgi:serine/threonine protein phosphatase PrpC